MNNFEVSGDVTKILFNIPGEITQTNLITFIQENKVKLFHNFTSGVLTKELTKYEIYNFTKRTKYDFDKINIISSYEKNQKIISKKYSDSSNDELDTIHILDKTKENMELNNTDIIHIESLGYFKNQNINTINEWSDYDFKSHTICGMIKMKWTKPSIIQQHGIIPLIQGQNIKVMAPAGTGKTGTFLIATLEKVDPSLFTTQAIILNPTRELAIQTLAIANQMNAHKDIIIKGAIGGVKDTKTNSKAQIIIGTPGRIFDDINRRKINTSCIKLFIIDEADQMLNPTFCDQITNIYKYIKSDYIQMAIYSATYPQQILQTADELIDNSTNIIITNHTSKHKSNIIQYYITSEDEEQKIEKLDKTLQKLDGSTIVFCSSRSNVEFIFSLYENNFENILKVHGEMNQNDRHDNINKFKTMKNGILITSDLLSRGIDIENIKYVINYDLPSDKEVYLHRINRSGRFDKFGVAINLINLSNPDEMKNMQDIAYLFSFQIYHLQ